ncbi:hypothetical protein ACFSZS_19960 [Seohaeicola zhoushanensis]
MGVISVLLSPAGYVIQDAVADAMSVEAVPVTDEAGQPLAEAQSKALHTTMQTLGRFALIGGTVGVALLNIVMFSGTEALSVAEKAPIYARIYLMALAIPVLSVSGVVLAAVQKRLSGAIRGLTGRRRRRRSTGGISSAAGPSWRCRWRWG